MFTLTIKSLLALASAVNLVIMPPEPKVINIVYASPKSTLASSALVVDKVPFQIPEIPPDQGEKGGERVETDEEEGEIVSRGIGGLGREEILGLIGFYFPKEPIMAKIAECESELTPSAKNKNSSAKGLLQILDGTWKHFNCAGDVLNAEDNLKCGVKILKGQGLSAWSESFICWKNF